MSTKSFFTAIILTNILLASTSCTASTPVSDSDNGDYIVFNDNVTKCTLTAGQSKNVKPFKRIMVSGNVTIHYTPSDKYSIKVIDVKNNCFSVSVADSILNAKTIYQNRTKRQSGNPKYCVLEVAAPEISVINSTAGSSLVSESDMKSPEGIIINSSSGSSIVIKKINTSSLISNNASGASLKVKYIKSPVITINSTSGAHVTINIDQSKNTCVNTTSGASTTLNGNTVNLTLSASSGANVSSDMTADNAAAVATTGAVIRINESNISNTLTRQTSTEGRIVNL